MREDSVINLTKFKVTPELTSFGVCDLSNWKEFQEIRNLLFYPESPTKSEITERVERLTEIAVSEAKKTGFSRVLVGCPPWMMSPLCRELIYHNMQPVVAFTKTRNDRSTCVVSLVDAA